MCKSILDLILSTTTTVQPLVPIGLYSVIWEFTHVCTPQNYTYATCTSYNKYMHNVNMYLKSITHFTAFAFCNVRAEIVN